MSDKIIIRKDQPIACHSCHAVAKFPINAIEEYFPMEIKCPHCQANNEFLSSEIFPKVDAKKSAIIKLYWPARNDKKTRKFLLDDLHKQSFREQTDLLADSLLSSLRIAAKIQESLQQLVSAMGRDIQKAWHSADNIQNHWNPKELARFIEAPFFCLRLTSLDSRLDGLLHLLISPSFYEGMHGFPLESVAGFRSQIVSPYSRLSIELPEYFLEKLGMPPLLELTVIGDKIVGPDVQRFGSGIPGTSEDIDWSPAENSIVISDSAAARTWLLLRGVIPWEEKKLPAEKLAANTDYYMHVEPYQELFRAALYQFIESGRVAITWEDHDTAILFASILAEYYRGLVLWISSSQAIPDKKRLTHILPVEPARVTPADFSRIECVIAVAQDEEDLLAVADKLHGYSGRLLLLLENPLLDTLDINSQAMMAYSLCNAVSVDIPQSWWENRLYRSKNKYETTDVVRALQGLK